MMLFDKEGHGIRLADQPNGHVLVVGSSGQGKTFFCRKKIEEGIIAKRKLLLIDYSGSYREYEAMDKMVVKERRWGIHNLYKTRYYFFIEDKDEERFMRNISDALMTSMKVHSYTQKKILQSALKEHFLTHSSLNFAEFFKTLERLWSLEGEKKGNADRVKEIEKLISKFDVYSDIKNLHIRRTEHAECQKYLTLIQLSDFSQCQRQFLAELFLALLWKETMINRVCKYNDIFLDEIQHLSMNKEGVLCGMLQEGRKFGISLILSTQFMSRYKPEEKAALMQAANILFFKPTVKEAKMYAGFIETDRKEEWTTIFRSLCVGEAVLLGHYVFDDHTCIFEDPLICEIC